MKKERSRVAFEVRAVLGVALSCWKNKPFRQTSSPPASDAVSQLLQYFAIILGVQGYVTWKIVKQKYNLEVLEKIRHYVFLVLFGVFGHY